MELLVVDEQPVFTQFTDHAYVCVFNKLYRLERPHVEYVLSRAPTDRHLEVRALRATTEGVLSVTTSYQVCKARPAGRGMSGGRGGEGERKARREGGRGRTREEGVAAHGAGLAAERRATG